MTGQSSAVIEKTMMRRKSWQFHPLPQEKPSPDESSFVQALLYRQQQFWQGHGRISPTLKEASVYAPEIVVEPTKSAHAEATRIAGKILACRRTTA